MSEIVNADPDSPLRGSSSPPPSGSTIFFGPDGLRAGWALLLFVSILYVQLYAASLLQSGLHLQPMLSNEPHSQESALLRAGPEVLTEGMALLCVVIATWTMSKIEGRPIVGYGFAKPRSIADLLAGAACGLGLLSLLVLCLRRAGLLEFDARLLFGRAAFLQATVWGAVFLVVALLEESQTRGYAQYTLARGLGSIFRWLRAPHPDALGFWTAALFFSFLFGLGHTANPGESPIGELSAGLIGLVFCLSLWRTGSLWWAIGFHAAWDWAQSYLYGVADSGLMVQGHLFATHPLGRPLLSGGLTGPEGSLYILPIVALTAAVILLTLPKRRIAEDR